MKIGIIDTGGGQRGIFAAGVLDYLLDQEITFDVGIGVSAGSANISSFIAGQYRRNYMFYTEYALREEYMSRKNIRSKGCYLDVQYIYGALSNSDGENPFGFSDFCKNQMEFLAVATDALTGTARYFGKSEMQTDHYNVLMGSCAMPYVCSPQDVNGTLCFDGAVSDLIPLRKAIDIGCERIILILNQPLDDEWSKEEDDHLAERIQDKFPAVAEALHVRAEKYNENVFIASELSKVGRVKIIAPDNLCDVSTLSNNIKAMNALYEKGYQAGKQVKEFLKKTFI